MKEKQAFQTKMILKSANLTQRGISHDCRQYEELTKDKADVL